MRILRSPDDAIDGLAGYPGERRWVQVPAGDDQRLRVHMVDANPEGSSVVVLLHGNPSWSYLWRHQVGPLVEAGYRVIAPDLVGMGMSDKPSAIEDYTVDRHVGGLYFAGAGTHPGAGIPGVVNSAKATANLLLGDLGVH